MIKDMKAASALGGKTTRACDSCLRLRARWFCGADDAFLCHGCDTLVHSVNQLASRHERVRLQTASNKVTTTTAQAWHSGFTRKARTPCHNKHSGLQKRLKDEVLFNNTSTVLLPVVPELGGEEEQVVDDDDETEEQMLCRVPVFEPFDAEFCNIYNNETSMKNHGAADEEACDGLDSFSGFLPSDMDLAEFAADVESLLGSSSEVFDCKEEAYVGGVGKGAMVKVKDEELDAETACHLDSVLDMTSEGFYWNIDSVLSTAAAAPEEEEKVVVSVAAPSSKVEKKREIFLRLNYEDVIAAWASQGSPWTTGNPPEFNSDDCWPDPLGSSGADVQCSSYGDIRSLRGHLVGSGDGGREARVSRYREKRRTRLFAKKIRYEVRKLNAEKRPRMKGRFVKRTCFVGANAFQTYQ